MSSKEKDRKQNRARRRATAMRKLRLTWGAERVFLAWIRTAIALMALGFLVARLGGLLRIIGADADKSNIAPIEATVLGIVLMGLGCVVSLVATWRYRKAHRNIRRGKVFRHSAQLAVLVGVLTAVVAVGLIIAFLLIVVR